MVIADDDRIDGRYLEVHQWLLSLLALQAPVATDLRLVAALLHVIKHCERMGDQCVNIAKLVPLAGHEPPTESRDARQHRADGHAGALAGDPGKAGVRAPRRRPRSGPRPPGRPDQQAQPRLFPARARDRRRPRHARVGDADDPRRPLPRADRRQRRGHRRADRLRRHRASSASSTTPRTPSSRRTRRPRRPAWRA